MLRSWRLPATQNMHENMHEHACLQNLNGPCPLLAIANILSLRNKISLPAGIPSISTTRLISLIGEVVLDSNANRASDDANLQQNIQDCFDSLGKLVHGMDINLRFSGIHAFEATKVRSRHRRAAPCEWQARCARLASSTAVPSGVGGAPMPPPHAHTHTHTQQ